LIKHELSDNEVTNEKYFISPIVYAIKKLVLFFAYEQSKFSFYSFTNE